jgi:replicative DNA helicase
MTAGSINLVAPDAEENLLAGCLESPAALMAVVGSGLKPEDFGSPNYEIIYRVMRDMMDRGKSVDKTTLVSQLDASGKLDLIGGEGVITRLAELDHNTHNAHDYADIVRDRSLRRSLFDATEEIVKLAHSEPDIRHLVGTAENMLYRVSDRLGGGAKQGLNARDLVGLYKNRKESVERILYPFRSLNSKTNGRERGSLTVWGGYSSDGKSIIGMQSALAAAQAGYSVGYFSLEMTEEELLYRLLSMHTGLSKYRIETGELNMEELAQVDKAIKQISELPLKTYHDPEYTPVEIRSIQMRENFDLIVVDYLQRFHFVDWQDIPRMAKQFKNIALSTKCCVDVLSQLTPANGVAPGKNPMPYPHMNSLYGGKATGHEANNVLFVWADRSMDPATQSWERNGTGKIISAKQRGGQGEFSFDIQFDKAHVLWKEPGYENVYQLPKADSQ